MVLGAEANKTQKDKNVGQAKIRQQLDATYGTPIEVITWIERSPLTDKWLLMVKVEDFYKGCVSPHYLKSDAEAAAKIVESEFSKYGRVFWSKPGAYLKACHALIGLYEDDDEVLAVGYRTPEGIVFDNSPAAVRPFNARLLEQDLLSKAVADSIDWKS